MTNYTIVIIFVFLTIACTKAGCPEEPDPLASHYITLESKEGDRFCLPYSGLRFVLPFDSLAVGVGKKDREEVNCGERKLGVEDFRRLEAKHKILIYKIKGIDKKEIASLCDKTLDPTGIFRLRDIEFNLRGDVIDEAIERGYVVRLAEDKSEFLWEKKHGH